MFVLFDGVVYQKRKGGERRGQNDLDVFEKFIERVAHQGTWFDA